MEEVRPREITPDVVAPQPEPDPYSDYPGRPVFREKTLSELVTSLVNPEKLQQYEGSYTLDELRGGKDGELSFNLRSSWIVGSSNTPQAGLRFRRNPLTGQYEVVGGEVYFPSSGIGVSHELDEDSGETQTFLNMKKEF